MLTNKSERNATNFHDKIKYLDTKNLDLIKENKELKTTIKSQEVAIKLKDNEIEKLKKDKDEEVKVLKKRLEKASKYNAKVGRRKAISEEERKIIRKIYSEGEYTMQQLANVYDVSKTAVYKIIHNT